MREEHLTYDSYGKVLQSVYYAYDNETNTHALTSQVIVDGTTGNDLRYLFTSQEYNVGTGLYNFGGREYDPDTARFLQIDPIEEVSSQWNWYIYVGNSPINFTDPSGLHYAETASPKPVFHGPQLPAPQWYRTTFHEYKNIGIVQIQYTPMYTDPRPTGNTISSTIDCHYWDKSNMPYIFNTDGSEQSPIPTQSNIPVMRPLTEEDIRFSNQLRRIELYRASAWAVRGSQDKAAIDNELRSLGGSPIVHPDEAGIGPLLSAIQATGGIVRSPGRMPGSRQPRTVLIVPNPKYNFNRTGQTCPPGGTNKIVPNKVRFIDDTPNMGQSARNYEDAATGARSNAATQRRQVPVLDRTLPDGTRAPVKFDGIEGNVLIDRKTSITTFPKSKDQALRQSQALRENGFTGRWEVPKQTEANRALKMLQDLGITNIEVKVVQ